MTFKPYINNLKIYNFDLKDLYITVVILKADPSTLDFREENSFNYIAANSFFKLDLSAIILESPLILRLDLEPKTALERGTLSASGSYILSLKKCASVGVC